MEWDLEPNAAGEFRRRVASVHHRRVYRRSDRSRALTETMLNRQWTKAKVDFDSRQGSAMNDLAMLLTALHPHR